MLGTITIEPPPTDHRIRRPDLVAVVGPRFDSQHLAAELINRCRTASPGTVHVVALTGAVPLWRALIEFDQILPAGSWELYEECLRCEERRHEARLDELQAVLSALPSPTTFESNDEALRTVLGQVPQRWPGATILVAGHWRRLPRRWPAWPGRIELLRP